MQDNEEPSARESPPVCQRTALAALVQQYQQSLGSYLLHLTGELTVALRLTQEAFVCAERAQVDVPSNRAIRSWLFRVATRLAYYHLRQQRTWSQPGRLQSERTSSAPAGSHDDESALVRSVLLELHVGERAALLLCDYEELPFDEAAAILGLSAERLRQRLARARARFRLTYAAHHAHDEQARRLPR